MKYRLLLVSFLFISLIILGAPSSLSRTGTAQSGLPNGVAAGDVTQTSAVLWARSRDVGMVIFEYASDAGFNNVLGQSQAEVTDPLQPVKIQLTGLLPNTVYYYRATAAAGATSQGRFRTPAALGTLAGLRFGVSGDWSGDLAPYPAIRNVPDRDLAFFVEHGDTVYADVPSPDFPSGRAGTLQEFRIKHNEVYSARAGLNAWANLRAVMAVLATVDDHEVIDDFAGGASPTTDNRFGDMVDFINDTQLYENGLQAFQEYNPIRNEFYGDTGDLRTAGERKLYRAATYGSDAAVFILDARSFRDAELPPAQDFTDPNQLRAFLVASFDPSRTMLGRAQMEDLKRDLLQAQQNGITWKFVLVPEPIQNFGAIFASDRFEGYAAERTELLSFIHTNNITNAVFIAADIHGTIINNLTYQTDPDSPSIPIGAFEITTGSVAHDAPFGPTVVNAAASAGLLTQQQLALYRLLSRSGKDELLRTLFDMVLQEFGYDTIGLEGSGLDATLVRGGWVAVHSYGWTEFEINAETQQLRVITYGMDAYTPSQIQSNPSSVLSRRLDVVSEFTVNPVR